MRSRTFDWRMPIVFAIVGLACSACTGAPDAPLVPSLAIPSFSADFDELVLTIAEDATRAGATREQLDAIQHAGEAGFVDVEVVNSARAATRACLAGPGPDDPAGASDAEALALRCSEENSFYLEELYSLQQRSIQDSSGG